MFFFFFFFKNERFVLIFFYYLEVNNESILIFFGGIILSFSFLYDLIINWPFQTVEIGKFYGVAASFFFVLSCMNYFWRFVNEYSDDRLFFDCFILGIMVSGFILSLFNQKYQRILRTSFENFD